MTRSRVSKGRDIESAQEPLLNSYPINSEDDKLAKSPSSDMALDPIDHDLFRPATRNQTVFFIGTSILLAIIAIIELVVGLPLLINSPRGAFTRYPKFFIIGDWGRDGDYNQTVVADMMALKARSFKPDFVISTGDNFYEYGLVSTDDKQFDTSFTEIYNQDELINVPWHVALGNHDYGETDNPKSRPSSCSHGDDNCFYGPAHQLDVRLRHRDPRWHCERMFSLNLANGDVEIFFIDTTPIIRSYADEAWAINRGGVLQQSPEDQLRELESRLAASTATWKILVGHHPIHTNHRPDHMFEDMVGDVEPIVQKYGVQMVAAGHDHNLQHLYSPEWGYHHITSGAGSSIGHGFYGEDDSPFQYAGNGFVAVEMSRNNARVEYIGVDSVEPLFTVDIPINP